MSELNLNKLKMQTPNICDENIKKLKELFPQIVSEDKIDFDILKQLLSNTIVEADDERYRLDWVGKKRSLLKANSPINKTLRPCESESVDFENTKKLFFEFGTAVKYYPKTFLINLDFLFQNLALFQ